MAARWKAFTCPGSSHPATSEFNFLCHNQMLALDLPRLVLQFARQFEWAWYSVLAVSKLTPAMAGGRNCGAHRCSRRHADSPVAISRALSAPQTNPRVVVRCVCP